MKNVHFAIPEIYGETLSYYELLRRLADKVNDLIDNYNTVPEQIAEEVKKLDAYSVFKTALNYVIHSIAYDNTSKEYALFDYKPHDLLYAKFNDKIYLYEATNEMTLRPVTELIPGTNIREVNISELFIELRKLIDTNKNNIEAVTAVANKNSAEISTLRTTTTKVFDNIAQMKADQHLKAGDKCKTLGYYTVNDGGSAYYYIRTKENSDIDDGGSIHILDNDYIAELIAGDYITPELFGAKGDGVTDDGVVLTNLFNYGLNNNIKNFVFTHDKYLVNSVTKDDVIGYFYKFDSVDNLKIIGLNSMFIWNGNIIDNEHNYGFFAFENCSDVKIDICGKSTVYVPDNNTPIIALVHCIKNNNRFDVTLRCENLRYGFRSGIWNNQEFLSDKGITNSKIKVFGNNVGYLFSCDLGSNLDVFVEGNNFSRICYMCGVDHAIVKSKGKTNIGAGTLVKFGDSNYIDSSGNRVIKGCSFITIDAVDTGSANKTNSTNAVVGFSSYGNDYWTRTNDVVHSDIVANIKLEKDGITSAFILQDGGNKTIFRNMKFNILDENTDTNIQKYVVSITSANGFGTDSVIDNFDVSVVSKRMIIVGTKSDTVKIRFKNCNVYRIWIDTSEIGHELFEFENCVAERMSSVSGTNDENKTIIVKNCNTNNYYLWERFCNYVLIDDIKSCGPTSNRPVYPNIGYGYYDTSLSKQIYYSSSNNWVDASNNRV